MVPVRVLGIALDPAGQHIVLLKPIVDEPGEPGAGRVLPIWIGEQEATSILIALSDEEAPRPLSHDLMKLLLDALESRIEVVRVTRLDEGTFYAEITLSGSTGRHVVDARPSDAVALALRAHAPILVATAVFEAAGIPAELAGEADDAADDPAESAADRENADSQVDEFKRFLDDVDPEDFQG